MIAAPITYSADDQALVTAFEILAADEKDPAYWSSETLKPLRARVKAFYIAAQNSRCCYCNRNPMSDNHRLWDVEHIAPRAKHVHFMFTPINLAAACPDCNRIKSEKEAFVNAKRKTYPSNSSGFRIIHPHFDVFNHHIFNQSIIYIPKTAKGKNTIIDCDLMRFAQNYIAWENSAADQSFEEEVDVVFAEVPVVAQAAVESIIAKLEPK